MLSLSTLFGVMMLPGLVLLMASFVVGLFEGDALENEKFVK